MPRRRADPAHEQLRDLGAVRRVRLDGEVQLHRADEFVVRERGEEHAPAVLDVVGDSRERGAGLLVREGREVPDGGATFDAVDEHRGARPSTCWRTSSALRRLISTLVAARIAALGGGRVVTRPCSAVADPLRRGSATRKPLSVRLGGRSHSTRTATTGRPRGSGFAPTRTASRTSRGAAAG